MKMGVAMPEGSVSNREREDSLKVMKQETAAQRFRSTLPSHRLLPNRVLSGSAGTASGQQYGAVVG
jgi:hypothetical protein